MHRTGITNLPLHYGTTPRWLFSRMVELSGEISWIIMDEFGADELLKRISDPLFFQAFSCVIGFDWHSSGTTTTTCGALKVALKNEEDIVVAGGKGATSRKTPQEVVWGAKKLNLSGDEVNRIIYSSRMSAKVDNSCVQDGYQLYHHCIFFSGKEWTVVQQGMGETYARRYHWFSSPNFVCEPHSGIASERTHERVLDMTAHKSEEARKISCDLACENPRHLRQYFRKPAQKTLLDFGELAAKDNQEYLCGAISMPPHHPILPEDLSLRSLETLKKAYEIQPRNFEELVAIEGMGPKKIRALALISELVYGARPSWSDPAKFSFAHGGKDGFPYPVDRKTYDATIQTLRSAIEESRLENRVKLSAIKRLAEFLSGGDEFRNSE